MKSYPNLLDEQAKRTAQQIATDVLAAQKPVLWRFKETDMVSPYKPSSSDWKPLYAAPVQQERNFCERCGKRLGSVDHIHTCTPPAQEMPFIQHEGENADDWSEWVDPKQDSYLMACCDCNLVHELQFRVAKFADAITDECEVIEDSNLHAQFRAKRRDDVKPQPAPVQEPPTFADMVRLTVETPSLFVPHNPFPLEPVQQDHTALLRQALEALEWEYGGEPIGTLTADAITAIREALNVKS
jgi:hypothetical protein